MTDERDTTDFLTAFAVGAVLGIGAALMLRPEKSTGKRILKEIAPYRKRMGRDTQSARKSFLRGGRSLRNAGDEMGGAGAAIARELRGELADMVSNAREELADVVEQQMKHAQRAMKRGIRNVGR